jgi:hypothetical protein
MLSSDPALDARGRCFDAVEQLVQNTAGRAGQHVDAVIRVVLWYKLFGEVLR